MRRHLMTVRVLKLEGKDFFLGGMNITHGTVHDDHANNIFF